jgi:myo-inositol-1(or 4)-monophosphatase
MDLQPIVAEAANIAREAGAFIRQEAARFDLSRIEFKGSPSNLVSYVDKEAERMLVDKLNRLLPEAGFVTEEGTTGTTPDETALNWIIDPLDGTTNFIHGLPVFSVSVGLAEGKMPVAGVVYDINRDECFSGWRGGGAWCGRGTAAPERVRVSGAQTLSESLIATGFPYYKFEQMGQYLHILELLMQQTHGLRRMGSAAIDLAYTACGRFDGFYEYNLNSWDMAAGCLLVQEAGGTVTDFSGQNNFLFGGDVVAGGAAQAELLAVIQRFF